jgi:hypothetical protein
MDETDSVLGTPRRFTPKIVGGNEEIDRTAPKSANATKTASTAFDFFRSLRARLQADFDRGLTIDEIFADFEKTCSGKMSLAGADNVALIVPAGDRDDPDDLDRASKIMRAAVTYASLNGAYNAAWLAEHTGDSTVAEIVTEGLLERRDAILRKG